MTNEDKNMLEGKIQQEEVMTAQRVRRRKRRLEINHTFEESLFLCLFKDAENKTL